MIKPLPAALLASLQDVDGFNRTSFMDVHASGEQITSVRFNPAKKLNAAHSLLKIADKIPWSSAGFYLEERPLFTIDPLFHAGAYYVQEASSMFLEEAIKQTTDLSKSLRVLDLCAAPGGKSTLIQSIISPDSLLVSNEVIKTRVNILSENMSKWGAANTVVTNNDPKDFQKLTGYFDLIVVDAPCSGSGLFRKDPEAIKEWSEDNVHLCSQRQQRILADILPALKPGGVLIYSTCSYSVTEDEEIADWLLSNPDYAFDTLPLEIPAEWNITATKSAKHNAHGYRFYPDKIKGEGFFIAAFRLKSGNEMQFKAKVKTSLQKVAAPLQSLLDGMIERQPGNTYLPWQQDILLLPANIAAELPILQASLYIKKAGVNAGSIIRDELIPSHELAMAALISNKIPATEVSLEDALQYLRKAEMNAMPSEKGWALIKYQGVPLGWVKVLSNRINNYYPKDWRILNK